MVGRPVAADAPFEPPDRYSLRLLRILFHLEAALGRSLPTAPFCAARRPSEFLAALAAAPPQAASLFLFPGIGGDDPWLMLFRAGLPPVTMIRYPDWPEQDLLGIDFDGLVDHVTAQILRQAPAGPLQLAGYSLGGHVGYATALRLRALGRDNRRLRDPGQFLGPRCEMGSVMVAAAPGSFHRHGAARRGSPVGGAFPREADDAVRPRRGARHRTTPRRAAARFRFSSSPCAGRGTAPPQLHPLAGQAAKKPAPLDVAVTLFRSEEHGLEESADLGWATCCPNLHVVPIRGTHHGMFDESNMAAFRAAFTTAMQS